MLSSVRCREFSTGPPPLTLRNGESSTLPRRDQLSAAGINSEPGPRNRCSCTAASEPTSASAAAPISSRWLTLQRSAYDTADHWNELLHRDVGYLGRRRMTDFMGGRLFAERWLKMETSSRMVKRNGDFFSRRRWRQGYARGSSHPRWFGGLTGGGARTSPWDARFEFLIG